MPRNQQAGLRHFGGQASVTDIYHAIRYGMVWYSTVDVCDGCLAAKRPGPASDRDNVTCHAMADGNQFTGNYLAWSQF